MMGRVSKEIVLAFQSWWQALIVGEGWAVAVLAAGLVVLALVGAVLLLGRQARGRGDALAKLADITERLAATQNELTGKVTHLAEDSRRAQSELAKAVNDRLDQVSHRMGQSLSETTEKTSKTFGEIKTRLDVIDKAQQNITQLSGEIVGLQDILSNKQERGHFGEIQLNDLVTSILPPSAYRFQETLSNGRRGDCMILLPNPPGPIVVDAKFPLESYRALKAADDETARTQAARAFKRDVGLHVTQIAERYIIPGETAESALMFLPSEAVYAELHANFPEVVEKGYRAKVWIVSPTTLMATLNTVRAVLRDARMREQAGVIQKEVHRLLTDVTRLDARVASLTRHFGQAQQDIRQIEISTGKITARGQRIEELELSEDAEAEDVKLAAEPIKLKVGEG